MLSIVKIYREVGEGRKVGTVLPMSDESVNDRYNGIPCLFYAEFRAVGELFVIL